MPDNNDDFSAIGGAKSNPQKRSFQCLSPSGIQLLGGSAKRIHRSSAHHDVGDRAKAARAERQWFLLNEVVHGIRGVRSSVVWRDRKDEE